MIRNKAGEDMPRKARKYQACTRCVMDTSARSISFDASGVCDYCRSAEVRLSTELFGEQSDSAAQLAGLIAEIKRAGRGKPYDCVIGVSGGVDSSYIAYLAKKVYGLRPLAVHFDNGWNSELAVQNIERLLKTLDIDLQTHVVDWEEFRDLQLAFLKSSVPNCEIPTDHGILALLYRSAAQQGVRYIVHGGNLSTESIMPNEWMHDAKDLRFLKSIFRRFGQGKFRTMPLMGLSRLAWYILVRRIRYVSLLNYLKYDKEQAIQLLEHQWGWRRYEEKHFESIYTRFFQGYLLPRKFKIDKRRPHFSSLILSGQMTRAEALELLEQLPCSEARAKEDVEYVRNKFGLSVSEFDEIMRAPVKSSDAYANSEWLVRKLSPMVARIKRVATRR